MQRLEVSGVVRPIYGSLGVKRLIIQRRAESYCHMWPVWLYTIFFHITLQKARFSKNVYIY